jgi:bifunctional DNA-binding transcriptional regulator/antitoxin component of YhaV-PrlF toxin-antitoxin module
MSSVKEVSKVFLTNKISATLIIPIELARRHGLNEPSHVIVEETPRGILIRKLSLNGDENRSNDNDI